MSIDQVVSDFDGVTFHISTPETKSKILISIAVKCFKELLQYGAQEVLEREYGQYITTPEAGYDFSVLIDVQQLPEDAGLLALFEVVKDTSAYLETQKHEAISYAVSRY